MRTIKFTHGIITLIAGDIKGGDICIVSVDDEDLHPVEASILAINCGYSGFKEMTNNYPDDCSGVIDEDFNINIVKR